MNEIDINIEGFNVNGICVGCLNYKRKMYNDKRVNDCFKLLGKIEVPECLFIQVCWECVAAVRTVDRFQKQIVKSFEILHDYSRKHMFLDNPSDLSQHGQTRLSISPVQTEPTPCEQVDKVEVEIKDEPQHVEVEIDEASLLVKTEDEDMQADDMALDDNSIDNLLEESREQPSSDDDMLLSKLKKKKKKKRKSKSQDDTKDEKLENKKLKNLPTDLVEIYTMTDEEMWAVRKDDVTSAEFQSVKYKCDDCIMGFLSLKLMNAHMEGRHQPKSSENSCQCNVCKAYFLTKENLVSHRNHHTVAFRCRRCGFRSTAKRIMSQHVLTHDVPVHKCTECDAGFNTRSKLTYHRSVCCRERPQCDCCGKVFANKMTLKYHLKANKSTDGKDDKPKEKIYIPCKGCDKVFHSKKSYRAHSVIHEGVTYPCQICGKLFQWKRNLARHTRNHREKEAGELHSCRECGKSFSSRDCYNNHMRLSKKHAHPDAYNHQCSFCGKKFATKWCMVDHVDWEHLKNIRYQCTICFKPFKTAKILVAHVKNIHEGAKREVEGEHLCEICGKSYKTEKRLKGHVWAMHTRRSTSKIFKCKLCPATFTWQTSIYKHMKMMHDTNKRNKPSRPAPLKKEDSHTEMEIATRIQYYQHTANGIPATVPPHSKLVSYKQAYSVERDSAF